MVSLELRLPRRQADTKTMSNIRITKAKPREPPPCDDAKSLARKWVEESKWDKDASGNPIEPEVITPASSKLRRRRR